MKTFAQKWPEIFWPLLLWAVTLSLSWLSTKIDGPPYNLSCFLQIVLHLIAFTIPCWFIGQPMVSDLGMMVGGYSTRFELKKSEARLLRITSVLFCLMVLVYFYIRKDFIGLGTAEAREFRKTIETNLTIARIYDILSPFALASGFFCMRWNPLRRAAFIYYGIVASAFAGAMIFSGARYEIVPVVLIMVATGLAFHSKFILSNIKRCVLMAAAAFVCLGTLNVVLNIVSFRGGNFSTESYLIEMRGVAILHSIGVEEPDSRIALFVALVDEYLFQPPRYLDYYYEVNRLPIAMGSHQFPSIAFRLGHSEGPDIKEDVDMLYLDLGIQRNVWATAIRELNIDFGKTGSVIASSLLGALMGFFKRNLNNYFSAQFGYVYFFAYFIFSPFSSILKASSMQASFYGVIILFAVEFIYLQNSSKGGIYQRKQPA